MPVMRCPSVVAWRDNKNCVKLKCPWQSSFLCPFLASDSAILMEQRSNSAELLPHHAEMAYIGALSDASG